ncbi:hypothetical protein MHYP_G00058100 [Metynnis hypsauchen]
MLGINESDSGTQTAQSRPSTTSTTTYTPTQPPPPQLLLLFGPLLPATGRQRRYSPGEEARTKWTQEKCLIRCCRWQRCAWRTERSGPRKKQLSGPHWSFQSHLTLLGASAWPCVLSQRV